MDFDERLQRAIQRGERSATARNQAARAAALSEEQLKRLHSQLRLTLSEYIERCLSRVPGFLPGFQYETVVSDRGWGAAVNRDDADFRDGRRGSAFSRLEVVVRPYSSGHILEISARGTIRNKEAFNRTHYQPLAEADSDRFAELIDAWVIEYAELFSARG